MAKTDVELRAFRAWLVKARKTEERLDITYDDAEIKAYLLTDVLAEFDRRFPLGKVADAGLPLPPPRV